MDPRSGPKKTLYNSWKRWPEKGVFAQIMMGPAAEHGEDKVVITPLIETSF
jgi:hypothetical protein